MPPSTPELLGSRPPWTPPFLREIESLASERGLLDATQNILKRDGIDVAVDGDVERLYAHTGGLLFAGDHKNQWEFVAIMDLLSKMGRQELLLIAKFYVHWQAHQALGDVAARHIVPVYPRILARDRGELLNSETGNRLMYRRFLRTAADSAQLNDHALDTAAQSLINNDAVGIFPCGSVVDAKTHPWRRGVGEIIQRIPDDAKSNVLIVPFGMEDISRLRLVAAVAMRGRGVFGRPQTMTLQLGTVQTVQELVDTLPCENRNDPMAITMGVRKLLYPDAPYTSDACNM
jgi:hypothetical protein